MLANAGIIRLMELDHAKDVKLAIAFSELYVVGRRLEGLYTDREFHGSDILTAWHRFKEALDRVDELTTAKV